MSPRLIITVALAAVVSAAAASTITWIIVQSPVRASLGIGRGRNEFVLK